MNRQLRRRLLPYSYILPIFASFSIASISVDHEGFELLEFLSLCVALGVELLERRECIPRERPMMRFPPSVSAREILIFI